MNLLKILPLLIGCVCFGSSTIDSEGEEPATYQTLCQQQLARYGEIVSRSPGLHWDERATFLAEVAGNRTLPADFPAKEGAVTLFADFHSRRSDCPAVPVYIVNRTDKAVSFPSQDGDVYTKLEFQDGEGHWHRAQSHQHSWCGNSYIPVEIPPGMHYQFGGYLPARGKKAKVRFKCMGGKELVSNVAEGFITAEDCDASEVDTMAISSLLPTASKVLLLASNGRVTERKSPDKASLLALLEAFSVYQENRLVRDFAGLAVRLEQDDKDFHSKATKLLSAKWPTHPQPEALVGICLQSIEKPFGVSLPSSLSEHPEVAWSILADVIEIGISPSNEVGHELRRRIYDALPDALGSDSQSVGSEALRLLSNTRMANEFIADTQLLHWLKSKEPVVCGKASELLIDRGKRDEVVSFAFQALDDCRIAIVTKLISKPPQYPGHSKEEQTLWHVCLRNQTDGFFQLFSSYVYSSQKKPLPPFLHDELNRVLTEWFAENTPAKSSQAIYAQSCRRMELGLRLLATYRDKSDLPLFLNLLNNPAFDESKCHPSEGPSFIRRNYFIRRQAAQSLENFSYPLPESVQLTEDIKSEN